VEIFTPEQERAFLETCDDWQFPLFLTLMLTGLRPGELTHLLLPDDLDLDNGILRVRNKPKLGWQVKTRNERDIPLVPVLVDVLRRDLRTRILGPLFRRRQFRKGRSALLTGKTASELEVELADRVLKAEEVRGRALSRSEQAREAKKLWRDMGAIKTECVRIEFMRLTRAIQLSLATAPKALRQNGLASVSRNSVHWPEIRRVKNVIVKATA
jgi:integrase